MKKLYIVSLGLSLLLTIPSCNYLDVVPDERPTEEDAFQDKYAAERYLYSCYSFMPQERQMGASMEKFCLRLILLRQIFCWEIFLLQIRGIIGFGPECMGRSEDAILFWRT
mgnify:CR=1 FL=1